MSDMLSGFYEAIMGRVKSECEENAHFDYYFGQYDNPETDEEGRPLELHFNCPADLFEYEPLDFETLGNGRMAVNECIFKIHRISDVPQEMASREKDAIRNKGYEHLVGVEKVIKAVKGFNSEMNAGGFQGFGSISFLRMEPFKNTGPHLVHILYFRVRLTQDVAKKKFTKAENIEPLVTTDNLSK